MQGCNREGIKGNWEIGFAQKTDFYSAVFFSLNYEGTNKA